MKALAHSCRCVAHADPVAATCQRSAAEISGSRIRATLYLPDPASGYYRGTRFDWSGVIASLQWDGHEYFGQWFERYDPTLHDAITGPVEEFLTGDSSLGYAEAKPGETFVRIGIGAVRRKPTREPYKRFETYDIVDPGKWTIANGAGWIEFTHELGDTGGYAYVYTQARQRERRHAGARALTAATPAARASRRASTTTTSSRSIGETTGPDFVVRFPFAPRPQRSFERRRRGSRQRRRLPAPVRGEADDLLRARRLRRDARDHDFSMENRKTGAGVRVTGDRPIREAVLLVGLEDHLPRTLHRRQRRSRQGLRRGARPTSSTRPPNPDFHGDTP